MGSGSRPGAWAWLGVLGRYQALIWTLAGDRKLVVLFLCPLVSEVLRHWSEGMRSHPLWIKTGSLACTRSLARALPRPTCRGVVPSWGPLEEPEAAGQGQAGGCWWLTGSCSRPAAVICFPRKREHPGRAIKFEQSHNPAQSLGKGFGLVGSAEGWDKAALDGRGGEGGVPPPEQDRQGWDPSPTPSPALCRGGVDPCYDNQRQGLAGFLSPPSTWHGNYVSYWCQLEVKL